MEPLMPKNHLSFPDSLKTGPSKGITPGADINNQDEIRPNLGIHNNGDMFICPIEPFLSHYGPCDVDPAIVDACMARLAHSNDILRQDQNGNCSWTDFKISPEDSSNHEDKTFKPLGKIVDAVLVDGTNNLNFLVIPGKELKSDIRGSTHKIDACFVEGEFRHKSMRAIVHLRILSACHHVLNEDPRRMWIFGLTFENSMVSVWYFSRSHSVKSIAFNWIQNPRMLVRTLLAFGRATPVELGVDPTIHVGPLDKNGKAVSYVYEVPNVDGNPLFFKTGRSLVPQRPVRISGRTTRVWEVTQVTSADGKEEVSGKKVILKDVWLDASDEHSKTEAENMDMIFKAADDFVEAGLQAEIEHERKANPKPSGDELLSDPPTVARLTMQFINRDPRFQAFDDATKERLRDNLTSKKYRSMFLTKLHAWKGITSKVVGQQSSRMSDLFLRPLLDEEAVERQLDAEYGKPHGYGSENATNFTLNVPNEQSKGVDDNYRFFAPKAQSRFIYEEVCTTLQNLDTLGDVVDALCQTLDALHILFAVGWVHRDISSNNIMAFRSGENQPLISKLADLEFSRPMIDDTRKPRADPRTGTPFFMPVEILARQYFFENFLLPADRIKKRNLAAALGFDETNPEYQPLSRFSDIPIRGIKIPPNADWRKTAQRNQAVKYNFQHDLESVWWILLWIITCRVYWELSATEVARCFKHDVEDCWGRKSAFENPINRIEDSLHGDLKKDFGSLLEDLREYMLLDYVMRPVVGHLELPESYSSIHALFSTKLREMQATPGPWREMKLERRKKAMEDTVEFVVESVNPLTNTGKRGCDTSEVEPRHSTRLKRTMGNN